jgi:hypothetical protein
MIESEGHLKTWPTSPQHMGTAERLRCNRRCGTRRKGRHAGVPSSDRNICVRWRWETQHGRGCDERRPAEGDDLRVIAACGMRRRTETCGWWRPAECGGGWRRLAEGGDLRLMAACSGGGRAADRGVLRLMARCYLGSGFFLPNWISIALFSQWGRVWRKKKKWSGTWLTDGRVGNCCLL